MLKVFITSIIVCMSMLFVQVYFTKLAKDEAAQYKQKYECAQNRSDSLYAELYPVEIELSRYQNAYEIFIQRNPSAAKQYADIIANETE
jgi:hypothetical protein